jgi:hypothetical protein
MEATPVEVRIQGLFMAAEETPTGNAGKLGGLFERVTDDVEWAVSKVRLEPRRVGDGHTCAE